jgi:hypothetical protein
MMPHRVLVMDVIEVVSREAFDVSAKTLGSHLSPEILPDFSTSVSIAALSKSGCSVVMPDKSRGEHHKAFKFMSEIIEFKYLELISSSFQVRIGTAMHISLPLIKKEVASHASVRISWPVDTRKKRPTDHWIDRFLANRMIIF